MSLSLHFSVMPVDENGAVVLRHVKEPTFGVADAFLWELLNEKESVRHFGEVVAGLELRWYRRTTMEVCVAERRNPTAADCYHPRDIRRDVEVLLARLAEMESRLPRRYRFQKSTRLGEWLTEARVFYAGRLFRVGADWGACKAWWSGERTDPEAILALLEYGPQIEYDLRFTSGFRCIDAIREDTTFVPGEPITIVVGHQSPREYFEPYLALMMDFCAKAEAGGFLVFTSRS